MENVLKYHIQHSFHLESNLFSNVWNVEYEWSLFRALTDETSVLGHHDR